MFCINSETKAQQYSEYTQYMFNPVVFNPAYTGQWADIPGAPKTFNFSIHSPFRESNAAIGMWVENDMIGFFQTTRLNGTFAYHLPLGKLKLSLGLDGGVTNWSVDPEDQQGLYRVEKDNDWFPNIGAGLWLYGKKFYVGLSAPDILSNENTTIGSLDEEIHYYGTAGLVLPLGRSVKFKPTILAKAVEDAPIEVDLTAHFLFRDFLWLGVAWSSFDSVDFLAELQLTDQLVAGYSYDLTVSELSGHGLSTHEIMLGYDFCFTKNKIVTPRYF